MKNKITKRFVMSNITQELLIGNSFESDEPIGSNEKFYSNEFSNYNPKIQSHSKYENYKDFNEIWGNAYTSKIIEPTVKMNDIGTAESSVALSNKKVVAKMKVHNPFILKDIQPYPTDKTSEEFPLGIAYYLSIEGLIQSQRTTTYHAQKLIQPFDTKIGFLPKSELTEEGDIIFHQPFIPLQIYYDVISFFRMVMDKFNNAEAHVWLVYNHIKQVYEIEVPEQIVSVTSVKHARHDFKIYKKSTEKHTKTYVMDIHSHNSMNPNPSGQDIKSDNIPLLYGIIGKLDNMYPEMTLRGLISPGNHVMVNAISVFEKGQLSNFGADELNKVSYENDTIASMKVNLKGLDHEDKKKESKT